MDQQTIKHPPRKPQQKGRILENPMHVNTGVVSDSIAGVRQFRTKAQTCKNTKQRKGEFAISSGSPPPTGPDPQTFLVLCLADPGSQRHRPLPMAKGGN
ncbi:MAG: hypothetical protein GY820_17835 [Gammaproteobacteria bacterium]|nr:hypothetical protein [Gammaproteobacteria bacterium]